jgi:hypothetical protein
MARAAVFAFSESGPQVTTHQAPMSSVFQSRPALSAPILTFSTSSVPCLSRSACGAVGDLAGA